MKNVTEAAEEITARSLLAGTKTDIALNNSIDYGDFIFTIAVFFIVFALIIGGFIYIRKYLTTRIGGIRSGSRIKIKDRLIIAQDKQIILLEVKNKILMIGISAQAMSTLGEFEKDESDDEPEGGGSDLNRKSFLNMLTEKFKTGIDNFDKNKKN